MSETPPEGFRQFRFEAPPGATTVVLVRHGESAPAHPDRPFPLARRPRRPAARSGRRTPGGTARRSPRARTHRRDLRDDIAAHAPDRGAARSADRPRPVEEPDLREVFLGDWEGGEFRAAAAAADPIFQQIFEQERWDVIPSVELQNVFDERVWRGFQRIVAAHMPTSVVIVVAHGGVIGQLLHRVTGSRRFAFSGADNASISEIVAHPNASSCGATTTSHTYCRCSTADARHETSDVPHPAVTAHARRQLDLHALARAAGSPGCSGCTPRSVRGDAVEVVEPPIPRERDAEGRAELRGKMRLPPPSSAVIHARRSRAKPPKPCTDTTTSTWARTRARRRSARGRSARRNVPAQVVGLHDRVERRARSRPPRRWQSQPSPARAHRAAPGNPNSRPQLTPLDDARKREQLGEHCGHGEILTRARLRAWPSRGGRRGGAACATGRVEQVSPRVAGGSECVPARRRPVHPVPRVLPQTKADIGRRFERHTETRVDVVPVHHQLERAVCREVGRRFHSRLRPVPDDCRRARWRGHNHTRKACARQHRPRPGAARRSPFWARPNPTRDSHLACGRPGRTQPQVPRRACDSQCRDSSTPAFRQALPNRGRAPARHAALTSGVSMSRSAEVNGATPFPSLTQLPPR